MADELGGTSTARVPAWKLRQQQRQNSRPPPALNAKHNDELGGTRSSDMDSTRRTNNGELGGTARVPAWKLREQMKTGKHNFDDSNSTHSVSTASSTGSSSFNSHQSTSSNISGHPSRTILPVSRVPGAVDPSLPPAFRAAFNKQQQRKNDVDNFNSLSSVHSRSTAGCSKTNSYGSEDSFGSLDSDDNSFNGEDSFASLDSDADEDDEAYRESRNQMARLEIEKQKQAQDAKRVGIGTSRFKKKSIGVHGTPLDFIAE